MSDSDGEMNSPLASPVPSQGDSPMSGSQSPGNQTSPILKQEGAASPKQTSGSAEVAGTASATCTGPAKQTKRRAARACGSCRARKVRCDVVEQHPCGNCKWDKVVCRVQESRRRKKPLYGPLSPVGNRGDFLRAKNNIGLGVSLAQQLRLPTADFTGAPALAGHLATASPGMLFQQGNSFLHDPNPPFRINNDTGPRLPPWAGHGFAQSPVFNTEPYTNVADKSTIPRLPHFITPLPPKLDHNDRAYLCQKGALAIPSVQLQNALLKAYVEFVHPYMPLLELGEFLRIVAGQGHGRTISLLLYQAVMFVAVAFVPMECLERDGYRSRKVARKAFFTRVRVLYDFDYEAERHVLVQSLLLMTYWYETPDDQKDTWHWMGVAISLAHTIGLHRNPSNIKRVDVRKHRLFKRIWWSCFMRDRLIALGMRRPTRIQDEDFDVPMLEQDDFEMVALPDDDLNLGSDCRVIRDPDMQRDLAIMCIEKAKLCVCISKILKTQYSVLSRETMQPDNTTESTMMLFPNKSTDNFESVQRLDRELHEWYAELPDCCHGRPLTAEEASKGNGTVAVQRMLLHLVYQATVAALHRPQFLPAMPSTPTQIQELARTRVCESAHKVIDMAMQLRRFQLEKYLPTTGVTVLLPAMIIHLIEMRHSDPRVHEAAQRGFSEGRHVLRTLQERYAAADFASRFLDAAYGRVPVPQWKQPDVQAQTDVQPPLPMRPAVGFEGSGQVTIDAPSSPYLSPVEMHSLIQHQQQAYLAKNTSSMDVGARSPPLSDSGSDGHGSVSPNSIQEAAATTICPLQTDMWGTCANLPGQEQYAADDLNVEQWLTFPVEGVTSADEAMLTNMYTNNDVGVDVSNLDWMKQHVPQQPLQHFQPNFRVQEDGDLTMMGISTAGQAA